MIGKNGTEWLEESAHIIEGEEVMQNGVGIGCGDLSIISVEGIIVARKKVLLEIGKKLAFKKVPVQFWSSHVLKDRRYFKAISTSR